MGFVKKICLFIFYSFSMLVLGFFTGMMTYRFFYPEINGRYQWGYYLQEDRAKAAEGTGTINALNTGARDDTASSHVVEELPENTAVSAVSEKLSADTQYVVVKNDLNAGTTEDFTSKLPHKYIGMNREQFLTAMENYEAGPPLSEREKGFVSLQVLSFSRERVVVRMDYRPDTEEEEVFGDESMQESAQTAGQTEETAGGRVTDTVQVQEPLQEDRAFADGDLTLENQGHEDSDLASESQIYGYYLAVYDNTVVAYEADKKTVFARTGVRLETLPENIQKQIIEMMWFPDAQSLLGFLEAYSS